MAIKTLRVFQEFTSAGYVPMPVAGNIDYGVTIAGTFPGTTPTTFQTDDPDIDVTLTATTDYYVWIRSHGTDWNPMYTRNVRVYPDSPLINNVVMGIIIANLSDTVPYIGATDNVDLGEFGITTGYLGFDTTPTLTPTDVGTMSWNDNDGTLDLKLKGGNVTLQIGQEQVTRIVNKTGANLLEADYQAVRISGAQGNRLKVSLAQANIDANSAETLGLVTETINNNQEGFITTSGIVRAIDTTGTLQGESWADGDVLYLSGTIAGQITNIKPQAPTHTVIMGYVVRAHATQGQIYVKVDNGYELDELHNVKITSVANKNILVYESATSLWKNKNIFGTQGYIPYFDDSLLMKDSPIFTDGTKVIVGGITPYNTTDKLTVLNGNISVDDQYGYNIGSNRVLDRNTLSGQVKLGTTVANDFLVFYANQIERARLSASGYLGLGLTNPSALLHIKGTTAYTNAIIDNNSASGGGYYSAYQNGIEKAIFGVSGAWQLDNSSDAALIAKGVGQGIQFYTNGSTSEKMGINSDGNVFVGQTPTYVAGATQLIVRGKTGAGFVGVNHYDMSIKGFMNTFNYVFQIGTSTFHSMAFLVEDIERGRVNSSGRLLWGTTTDNTTDLVQINGSLIATSIKKSGGTSSQYLMADGSVSSGNAGTVTSVAMSVPTGLSISGSPITSSGTLAVSYALGYAIPTTASQATWDTAYNRSLTSIGVSGTTTKTLTLTKQDGTTLTASWTDINTDAVTSVFGRTGAIVATSGDYTTAQVTESGNLYYTDARARASISGGTGISYNSTSGVITNTITQYTDALARASLSFTAGSGAYNSTTGVITIPTNTSQLTNGAGYISGNQTITLSGDVSGSGATAITTTLATITQAATGSFVKVTLDTKGRVTGNVAVGSSDITTALGYTPYNSTNPNGYITSSALSSYLPLSGGTMSGVITTPNGTFGIIIGDDSRLADRNVANTLFVEGNQNNDRGYINFSSTSGNSLGAINGGALTWNGNTILTSSNYNSYSPTLTGGGASGTWGISISGNASTVSSITSSQVTTALGYTPVTNARQLTINGTTYDLSADRSWTVAGTIGGLTTNYIPKATSATTLGNSLIYDNGTEVGIGTTNPQYKLHVISSSASISAFRNSGAAIGQVLVGNTVADLGLRILASGDAFIFSDTSKYLAFGTNGATERMRLDSSGNLGLGVTPSAWVGAKAISVGNAGSYYADGITYGWQTGIVANAYRTGGATWAYQNTGIVATRVEMSEVNPFTIFTAPSGTAGNAISFTQAMTLNASGNLCVGDTSDYNIRMNVVGLGASTSTGTGSSNIVMLLRDTSAGGINVGAGIGFAGNDGVNIGVTFATINGRKENSTSGNYASYLSFRTRTNGDILTEQLRIASTGAATFSSSVTVTGALSTYGLLYKNPSATTIGALYTTGGGAGQFYLYDSAGTEKVLINTIGNSSFLGGNVGIGTTSPSQKLEVVGVGKFIQNTTEYSVIADNYNGSTDQNYISLRANGTQIGAINRPSGTNDIFLFSYYGNLTFGANTGGNATERMRITSGGNVLVNTTSSSDAKFIANGDSSGYAAYFRQPSLYSGYYRIMRLYANSNVVCDVGSNDGTDISFTNNQTGLMSFGTSGAERMRITSGGNVLIGTTTDSGYKLNVNGTGRFSGDVAVTTSAQTTFSLISTQTSGRTWSLHTAGTSYGSGAGSFVIRNNGTDALVFNSSSAATFSSSVTATSFIKTGGTSSQYLMADGSVTTSSGGVGGSGTTNYIPKWNGTTSLANSQIFDNGTQVTVGSNVAMYKFAVNPVSNSYFGIGFTGTNQIFVNAVDSGFTSVPIVNNALSHTWLIGFNDAMLLNNSGNLLLGTTTGISGGGKLQVNGDVNINGNFKINGTVIGGGGGSGITGSGTTNMIAKWTGGTSLGDSALYDNGAYSIGIGTTSVSFPTDRKGLVVRPNGANSGELLIQSANNTNGTTDGLAISNIYNDGAAIYQRANLHLRFGTNNLERMRILESGQLLIGITTSVHPDYIFQLPNNITKQAIGYAWTTYSDLRVKQNVQDLDLGLKDIMKLKSVRYNHFDSTFENNVLTLGTNSKNTIGFIAQEVNEVIKEAVTKGSDSTLWSMDYNKLVPVLVKAIQELKGEIDLLKEK